MGPVSSYCYCNKMLQSQWLTRVQMYSLTLLEVISLKVFSRVVIFLEVSRETLFLVLLLVRGYLYLFLDSQHPPDILSTCFWHRVFYCWLWLPYKRPCDWLHLLTPGHSSPLEIFTLITAAKFLWAYTGVYPEVLEVRLRITLGTPSCVFWTWFLSLVFPYVIV